MAIDTAERRRAVAALSGAHSFGPGVTPNAAQDTEWRQQAGWGYSGILPSGAVVSVVKRSARAPLRGIGGIVGITF